MSWVRLDDAFYRNDKQLAMSDAAFRLFVCTLSFCMAEKEPIGFLTTDKASALARYLKKGPSVIKQLVILRAWEVVPAGFLIHDFDEFVDHGSRDRVRRARDLKRQDARPVTGASVTGNGGVAAPRGSARAPVPDPVPVPERLLPTSIPPSPLAVATIEGQLVALLQRQLTSKDRLLVMRWSELERNGNPISGDEIVECVRRVITKPTSDGTYPGLAYCNDSVLALARSPLPSSNSQAPKQQAVDDRVKQLMGGNV